MKNIPPGRLKKVTAITALAAGLFVVLYIYLHYSETGRFPNLKTHGRGVAIAVVMGVIIALSLYLINQLLDSWITWRKNFTTRLLTGYLLNVVIATSITIALGLFAIETFGQNVLWTGFTKNDEDVFWKILILYLTSLFIYNVVYAILFSYQHYAVAQIENIQRDRRQLELQFEALKSQISPHYLFNSLNTISSLIFKDLPSAEQFIRRLAQTYQFILNTQHKRYVRLQEEVDFLLSYYYLLRIRFQHQLEVEINLPHSIMDSKIPPLTLQILVENAVKHNPMRHDKKLTIHITQDNAYLKVINTKTGEQDQTTSFHIGLENIQKRYRYFTDRTIKIRDEDQFSVSLPLIHSHAKLKAQVA